MKVRFLFLAAVCFSLGSLRGAQSDSPSLREATAPLADGVPQVAVTRLRAFLAQNPPAAERTVARRKLVEALVRVGQPSEALELFSDDPGLTNDVEATFWRAQALAALERWAEALPSLRKSRRGHTIAAAPLRRFSVRRKPSATSTAGKKRCGCFRRWKTHRVGARGPS